MYNQMQPGSRLAMSQSMPSFNTNTNAGYGMPRPFGMPQQPRFGMDMMMPGMANTAMMNPMNPMNAPMSMNPMNSMPPVSATTPAGAAYPMQGAPGTGPATIPGHMGPGLLGPPSGAQPTGPMYTPNPANMMHNPMMPGAGPGLLPIPAGPPIAGPMSMPPIGVGIPQPSNTTTSAAANTSALPHPGMLSKAEFYRVQAEYKERLRKEYVFLSLFFHTTFLLSLFIQCSLKKK